MKLKVLGCYSPNFSFKTVSCYRIELNKKVIYLDLGYLTMRKIKKSDYNNMIIVISHNHIDHAMDLINLALKLKFMKKYLKQKITIYMPSNSKGVNIYRLLKKHFSDVLDIKKISENKVIYVDNAKITFCKTIHKGESYAIKIQNENKVFVYTSDLAKVNYELIKFCKKADMLLVEGGHAKKNNTPFGYYHGYTKEILESINYACAKLVIVTHLETRVNKQEYIKKFPNSKYSKYICVEINKEYLI